MKKKLLLPLTVCMIISLLAGCGTEKMGSSGASSEGIPETTQTQQTKEPETENSEEEFTSVSQDSAEESASEAEENKTIDLPLTENEVSFTMWHDFVPLLAEYMDGMQDNLVYQTMEERTGVHMEISSVTKDSAATALSLVIASGDYPNLIDGFAGYYGQGIDTAIEADIILDLAEYKELMPNYFSLVDGTEEYAKETYTDSGAMGLAYTLNEKRVMESGLVLRKDWLEELNMDAPVTYDDFTEVLTAMKNTYGGYFWTTYLGDDATKSISAGYGITAFNSGTETYFEQIDGKVVFSPLEEGYLEYVTQMNEWYNAGILYPDFISGTGTTTCDADLMGSGQISMVSTPAGPMEQFFSAASDESFDLVAVARPVKQQGDVVHQGASNVMVSSNGFSVCTSVDPSDENFEILLTWLDYWYTEDGSLLANYGVEGETFEYDENGNPVFTDLMTNNPDGLAFTLCMNRYTLFVGSFVNDNTRTQVNYTDKQAECVEAWTQTEGDSAYVYPINVSLTVDESDLFNSAYNDIATYVESETLGFITGTVPLSEYDNFCQTIESMGIEDLIQIYQDALDRYNAR